MGRWAQTDEVISPGLPKNLWQSWSVQHMVKPHASKWK